MGTHRLFVGNGVYPKFRSTPSKYRDFPARADDIAGVVRRSKADCATFGELGFYECQSLASELGGDWQYDRSQGNGRHGVIGEGLNSIWTKKSVFDQPENDLRDCNMPSAGQAQRTYIDCRIREVKDPTAHVTLGCFHETLGDAAKFEYTKALVRRVGNRRALIAGDFPLTADDDDLAYMKQAGFVVHERSQHTPMTAFTRRGITVTGVDHVSDLRLFDHQYLLVDFTIPTGKVPPA